MKRRKKVILLAAVFLLICLGYSFFEPYWLETTRETVCSPRLPAAFDGLELAFISDTHVHSQGTLERLEGRVALINAQSPDVVLLGGDYAESQEWLQKTLKALGSLKAPLGVFAVTGNHDDYPGIHKLMRENGITPCDNQTFTLTLEDQSINITGLTNLAYGQRPSPQEGYTLLLAHEPELVEEYAQEGGKGDMALAGHTHGGQVTFFGLFGVLTDRAFPAYSSRWVVAQGIPTYYSNGAGEWFPLRFFARPQINFFTLKCEG